MTTELSGVDLARQALAAAREQAKKHRSQRKQKPKRRTGKVLRRDGREPLGLGTAITWMMTERGMAGPAADGDVLAPFDDILAAAAPEPIGHAQAVKFDTDTGRLDVVPDAPTYETKLRWSAPMIAAPSRRTGRERAHPVCPAAGRARGAGPYAGNHVAGLPAGASGPPGQ